MSPTDRRDRADALAGVAVTVGGLVAGVASRLSGPTFGFFDIEALAVLAAGAALVVGGALMLTARAARTRDFVAVGCLVVAVIPVGLSVNLLLGALRAPAQVMPVVLALGGSVLAAAGSAAAASRRARIAHGPGLPLLLAAGGGVLAVVGALLPWVQVPIEGGSISGVSFTVGKVTLGLALFTALAAGVAGVVRAAWGGTALVLMAASAAAVATVLATHGGVLVRLGVGVGVYLVAAGGVLALASILAEVLRSLGLPHPAPAPWVSGVFLAFGILGLVISFLLQDRLEVSGGSVFGMRLAATFLLLTGVGLAARQTWAWLLGFPVALAGIANGGLLAFTEETRLVGYLAILVYGNALLALSQSESQAMVSPGA